MGHTTLSPPRNVIGPHLDSGVRTGPHFFGSPRTIRTPPYGMLGVVSRGLVNLFDIWAKKNVFFIGPSLLFRGVRVSFGPPVGGDWVPGDGYQMTKRFD